MRRPQFTRGNSRGESGAMASPDIDRYTVILDDGETCATFYPVFNADEIPRDLFEFLCNEINMEIDKGETLPFFDSLTEAEFEDYWFGGSFAVFMVIGDDDCLVSGRQWEREWLGSFFLSPKYPKRSGHICTGNMLVNAGIRGKGIGKILMECMLRWAPLLGYTYAFFDLVYATNLSATRLFEAFDFKQIGKIANAGVVKNSALPIDAYFYGRGILINEAKLDPNKVPSRFEKLRYYLQTGKYPENSGRLEKLRLRASVLNYSLVGGALLFKGREVIEDPIRQIDLITECHLANDHSGINKTTMIIAERYHWLKIKLTVAKTLRSCQVCKYNPSRSHGLTGDSPASTVVDGSDSEGND